MRPHHKCFCIALACEIISLTCFILAGYVLKAKSEIAEIAIVVLSICAALLQIAALSSAMAGCLIEENGNELQEPLQPAAEAENGLVVGAPISSSETATYYQLGPSGGG